MLFTDWLSMMAAPGVVSCPSFCRTWPRSSSSTRSQVPSARHLRKYHHTVPQGGRHGAPFATVCHHATRTVCRLPPPAGPRCAGDPGPAQGGQQGLQMLQLGIRQIAGIRLTIHTPKVTTYPPTATKPSSNHFTIILAHPLRKRSQATTRSGRVPKNSENGGLRNGPSKQRPSDFQAGWSWCNTG